MRRQNPVKGEGLSSGDPQLSLSKTPYLHTFRYKPIWMKWALGFHLNVCKVCRCAHLWLYIGGWRDATRAAVMDKMDAFRWDHPPSQRLRPRPMVTLRIQSVSQSLSPAVLASSIAAFSFATSHNHASPARRKWAQIEHVSLRNHARIRGGGARLASSTPREY